MISKTRIYFASLLSALFVFSTAAQAQVAIEPQPAAYAGLLLGYGDPTNLDGRLAIGANVGLLMPSGYKGGIFFLGNSATEANSVSHFGVELGKGLGMIYAPLSAGVRVGLETSTGDNSATNFAVGPYVALDYMVRENLSFGVEPSMMFSFGDNSHSTLYVFATGKYWF